VNNNYCKSPWTGVFIETDGSVKSCCAGGHYWGNLNENTIDEILTKPEVIGIKQGIINNQPVEYCKGCRRDEEATGYSLRNYYDQFTTTNELLNSANDFVLRNIDIRWNALCNLNCVYCNERSSTKWQGLKGIPIESLERQYYDHVLDFIKRNGQDLEVVLLVGGEPLLPRQNRNLLDNIPDDKHIDLISNLSSNLDNNQVFQRLQSKKDVSWQVSFESIGSKFEYVRHGANWKLFVDNLKKVKSIPGHRITALPVYCIYSALNLIEIYEFIQEIDIQIHWQKLWGPNYLNVTNFSPRIKQLAIEEISRVLDLPYLDKFTSGMNRVFFENQLKELTGSSDQNVDSEFLKWTEKYETTYATDAGKLADVFPKLNDALRSQ